MKRAKEFGIYLLHLVKNVNKKSWPIRIIIHSGVIIPSAIFGAKYIFMYVPLLLWEAYTEHATQSETIKTFNTTYLHLDIADKGRKSRETQPGSYHHFLKIGLENKGKIKPIENIAARIIKSESNAGGGALLRKEVVDFKTQSLNAGQTAYLEINYIDHHLIQAYEKLFPNWNEWNSWKDASDKSRFNVPNLTCFFDVQVTAKDHQPIVTRFYIEMNKSGMCVFSAKALTT